MVPPIVHTQDDGPGLIGKCSGINLCILNNILHPESTVTVKSNGNIIAGIVPVVAQGVACAVPCPRQISLLSFDIYAVLLAGTKP